MRAFRTLLLAVFVIGFGVATSHAQSITAYFNFTCSSATFNACGPGGTPLTQLASPEGSVTLTLQSDGTVEASLTDSSSDSIADFAFDDPGGNLPESGFSPVAEPVSGFDDPFGYQATGFGDPQGPETWIIGDIDEFGSLSALLNGGHSSVEFYLKDSNGQFGADAEPVPEGGAGPMYLLLAAAVCFGTMVLGSRSRLGARAMSA
jgi:hypothetical protein